MGRPTGHNSEIFLRFAYTVGTLVLARTPDRVQAPVLAWWPTKLPSRRILFEFLGEIDKALWTTNFYTGAHSPRISI